MTDLLPAGEPGSDLAVLPTEDSLSTEDAFLHYARHENPALSLCGLWIEGTRVHAFSRSEICDQCIELTLDWIDQENEQGRETFGSPYVFKAIKQ